MRHANPEAEKLVLGALLDCNGLLKSSPDAVLSACGLNRSDFSLQAAQIWFEAIQTLISRSRPVDANSVWTLTKGRSGIPDNGLDRLQELQNGNLCTLPALLTHVEEVKRLAKLRALVEFHNQQLKKLESVHVDPSHLSSELDIFARNFTGTEEDFYTADRDLLEIAEEWDQFIQGQRLGFLPTGIETLDEKIKGWEENLNIVGGASSIGKSSLLAPSIYNALLAGHRVAVFGLEDGTKWITKRLLSRKLCIPVKDVGKTRLHDFKWDAITSGMNELSTQQKQLFGWKPRDGERITSGKLVQLCKRAIHQHKVRAVFIDHGLEVEYEAKHKGEELRVRMDRCFSVLRSLAFSTHTPIVVAVHFNREGAKLDGPPRQEHFAECAGIERMSRLSLALWRRESDGQNEVRCTVIKQTDGPRDVHLMLERHAQHALIANEGGRVLDLVKERQRESSRRTDSLVSEVDFKNKQQAYP